MKYSLVLFLAAFLANGTAYSQTRIAHEEKSKIGSDWTQSFDLENADFSSTGKNKYFILEPGYQLILEGTEVQEKVRLVISALDETQKIGNVEARVIEERETANRKLIEISRNFFAHYHKCPLLNFLDFNHKEGFPTIFMRICFSAKTQKIS